MIQPETYEDYHNRNVFEAKARFKNHTILLKTGDRIRLKNMLVPNNDWVEIVFLRTGLYVGGDIESVLFEGKSRDTLFAVMEVIAKKYDPRHPQLKAMKKENCVEKNPAVFLDELTTFVEEFTHSDSSTPALKLELQQILEDFKSEESSMENVVTRLLYEFESDDLAKEIHQLGEVTKPAIFIAHQAVKYTYELLTSSESG